MWACLDEIVTELSLTIDGCVIFLFLVQYGRTETIVNSQDPDFATPIQMSYRFEEVQRLRFVVYDIDNATPSLSDDDLLGHHECTLAQVCAGEVLREGRGHMISR